jgi:hypothetical protein
MFSRRLFCTLGLVALVASTLAINTMSAKDDLRIIAPLNGSAAQPRAKGKADYRVRGSNARLNLEVEKLRNVSTVKFLVNGQVVGTAQYDGFQAELEIRRGAPQITKGTRVVAQDNATGEVIASGTF